MTTYSDYWLDDDYQDDIDEQSSVHFNLIKLAVSRRAVSNFVNILTGKSVPVYFTDDGDVINMPGRTAQLAAQGPDLSNKIWQDGWDGANMFDQKQIETLDATYGATVGTVARGLAQGKTPGEIIANQGLDSEELRSIVDLVFNQPDTFRPILDQYKRAQLSPGRTTARNVLGNRQTDNPFYKLAFNTLVQLLLYGRALRSCRMDTKN